ncbi:bifunctional transcriptional activator/DNA repair enzyme protein Ada [Marivivens niveibacter]|uniref:Methylated-DNA--protein-cysteine methyltransferase n=1 Tax=Marivivens niveibacter TaxID=1930667 RepID=A0A251WXN8_9RHOB|nr:trifunctional transcriptional activator/DNA repair protein Ada/methylated-DNA--[protein]-cysteine S-methyltransferase [Marivivens niveibacter]OUD09142.1 bifunctional transcriptional activator/DNA repair enzyme protein Ada [Marivivens niveibacter]
MLFTLPDDNTLYDALLARDPSYEGRAFVGVRSTGIFCRLTCPARKPLRENCEFFDSTTACAAAGYRPCKRCHPIGTSAAADPVIARLLDALDTDPDRKWAETDIAAMGLDTSTVRRLFRRHFGMTFIQMARQRRLRIATGTIARGGKVIEAQLDAGYDSPTAFRKSFAAMLGVAPSDMQTESNLKVDFIDTPLGPMIAIADDNALRMLEFPDRKALATNLKRLAKTASLSFGRTAIADQTETELCEYFAGTRAQFTVPLAADYGTSFQRSVWTALRDIPAGHTVSYGALADTINNPTAVRAVAAANGANQIALIIPCHRVIGADGTLTGYAGGLWRKQRLIEIETQYQ